MQVLHVPAGKLHAAPAWLPDQLPPDNGLPGVPAPAIKHEVRGSVHPGTVDIFKLLAGLTCYLLARVDDPSRGHMAVHATHSCPDQGLNPNSHTSGKCQSAAYRHKHVDARRGFKPVASWRTQQLAANATAWP